MTQEEKARAYDEALERAKKWLTPEFSHDMLYDILPELAESEDERIRKELIETVKCIADGDAVFLSEQQKQRYLAWLEKQKEPLAPEEKMNHPLYLEGFDVGREVQKVFDEQKPAEWSEEDNIGWDEAFACVTRVEKAAKNEEELQNAVTAEKWLKEIKFKYCVHPVKSEWSEED